MIRLLLNISFSRKKIQQKYWRGINPETRRLVESNLEIIRTVAEQFGRHVVRSPNNSPGHVVCPWQLASDPQISQLYYLVLVRQEYVLCLGWEKEILGLIHQIFNVLLVREFRLWGWVDPLSQRLAQRQAIMITVSEYFQCLRRGIRCVIRQL